METDTAVGMLATTTAMAVLMGKVAMATTKACAQQPEMRDCSGIAHESSFCLCMCLGIKAGSAKP